MKRQADTERKLYTLCILVQDIPGVLSQVARLFSRKGYNIESIVSGETDKPGITRITIGILADQTMLEQKRVPSPLSEEKIPSTTTTN